jgi:hypothetical protein
MLPIRSLIVGLTMLTVLTSSQPALFEHTIFRNESRFKYVHMTMVEQLDERNFLYAFQASKIGEGHLDQRIVLMRSEDFGETWSEAVDIVWGDNTPVWGPCLFHNSVTNITYLYYSLSVPQNVRDGGTRHYPGGSIMVVQSTDYGLSWSTPRLLLPYDSPTRGNVSKMTANKPIFLSQDKKQWALPFWQEVHPHNKNDTGPLCAGILVTLDGGETYEPVGFIESNQTWLIENNLVPVTQLPASHGFGNSNLTLVQYFRVRAPIEHLHQSISKDGGATWSEAGPIGIENPDSKTSSAAMVNDTGFPTKIMLACNPSIKENRQLLVALQSTSPLPIPADNITYGEEVKLGVPNAEGYSWSYPTVLAVNWPYGFAFRKFSSSVASRGTGPDTILQVTNKTETPAPTIHRHFNTWAVSFTAWGTSGGKLAWIVDL